MPPCDHWDIGVIFEEALEDGLIFERVKCNDCGLTWTNVAPPKEEW